MIATISTLMDLYQKRMSRWFCTIFHFSLMRIGPNLIPNHLWSRFIILVSKIHCSNQQPIWKIPLKLLYKVKVVFLLQMVIQQEFQDISKSKDLVIQPLSVNLLKCSQLEINNSHKVRAQIMKGCTGQMKGGTQITGTK